VNASERKQRERAAAIMLAQAAQYELQATAPERFSEANALRLRGRALQMRGSAWVMQSEVMEDTDG